MSNLLIPSFKLGCMFLSLIFQSLGEFGNRGALLVLFLKFALGN
jgi:hypothetical protein